MILIKIRTECSYRLIIPFFLLMILLAGCTTPFLSPTDEEEEPIIENLIVIETYVVLKNDNTQLIDSEDVYGKAVISIINLGNTTATSSIKLFYTINLSNPWIQVSEAYITTLFFHLRRKELIFILFMC